MHPESHASLIIFPLLSWLYTWHPSIILSSWWLWVLRLPSHNAMWNRLVFVFLLPMALSPLQCPFSGDTLEQPLLVSIGLSASRSRKVKLETRARSEKLLGVKLTFFPRFCFVISLRLWKQMQADALMMMFSSYFSDKLRPFYVIYV